MADPTLLEGVAANIVDTSRLRTCLLSGGAEGGAPVFFVHGNASSSRFFEETLAALPGEAGYRGFAPDLRGFGGSEAKPVDATRGLGDFSDDLYALAGALGLRDGKIHLVGWSAGGAIAVRYAMDHPDMVASLTLVNPMSPYGFGGTRDASGIPCWPDNAGSGGGTTNPEFVRRLREGDRSEEDPNSPRNVMNAFYFKPPFGAPKEREEVLLSSMLSTKVAEGNYPGDATPSNNWPNVAPGKRGMNNAISPKYCNLGGFARIDSKPPVLWIRGADDALVSDTSLLDLGYLGQIGVVPGWPGEEVYPPQPMVSQTRAVLEAYVRNGGSYREEVIEDCGHSPHVEKPEEFRQALFDFLEEYPHPSPTRSRTNRTMSTNKDGKLGLPDGVDVPFRLIRPDDVPALRRFHGRLSEKSIHSRFFGSLQELPEAKANYFAHVDGVDHLAFVALDPDDPDEIIALVRYDREAGSERAEYSALVEDLWQGHGVGTELTRQLVDEARDKEVRFFYAMVMGMNTRMLELLRHLDLPEHERVEDGVKHVEVELVSKAS